MPLCYKLTNYQGMDQSKVINIAYSNYFGNKFSSCSYGTYCICPWNLSSNNKRKSFLFSYVFCRTNHLSLRMSKLFSTTLMEGPLLDPLVYLWYDLLKSKSLQTNPLRNMVPFRKHSFFQQRRHTYANPSIFNSESLSSSNWALFLTWRLEIAVLEFAARKIIAFGW